MCSSNSEGIQKQNKKSENKFTASMLKKIKTHQRLKKETFVIEQYTFFRQTSVFFLVFLVLLARQSYYMNDGEKQQQQKKNQIASLFKFYQLDSSG